MANTHNNTLQFLPSSQNLNSSGTFSLNITDAPVDADTANAVYTIDFDLRKSVVKPVGQPGHFLRPGLRLVQNLDIGSIPGTVDDIGTDDEVEFSDSINVTVVAGEETAGQDFVSAP